MSSEEDLCVGHLDPEVPNYCYCNLFILWKFFLPAFLYRTIVETLSGSLTGALLF
jgi:hypothetical protein